MSEERPRILIATQYFAPKNEIAAVRLTNYAIGLVECGWQVDVLTTAANEANPLERRMDLGIPGSALTGINVIEAPVPLIARALYGLREAAGGGKREIGRMRTLPVEEGRPTHLGTLRRLAKFGAGRLQELANSVVQWSYAQAMLRVPGLAEEYEVVWASFGPPYIIDAGNALADRYPSALYVADVRDPIARGGPTIDERTRRLQKELERKFLQRAQLITAAADGLVGQRHLIRAAVHTLTNGFDPEVIPDVTPGSRSQSEQPITLYYGGRLYAAQQFESLVLGCLEISRRQPIEVHYAGGDAESFVAAFARLGADHLVHSHGRVSRAESLALARSATCNLVFSWNGSERGVLTGKVFELISTDRPILTVIAGEYKTSALAAMFVGDPYRQVVGSEPTRESVECITEFISEAKELTGLIPYAFSAERRYRRVSSKELVGQLNTLLRANLN